MNSEQIILDFKSWKKDSFKAFFENFYPSLCLFANKYINDREASSDVVQEAFLYLWNRKDDVDSINSAKTYLFKYVKNRSLNYLRDHERRRKNLNFQELDSEIFYRDNLIEEETYRIIYDAIKNLPPQGQKVIELSLDGLKNQEIADELSISINTVKTIKLRAFKAMREELKDNIFILFMHLNRPK
jgi:RNA polymerase sigma-70 factor (ECF subfamily)